MKLLIVKPTALGDVAQAVRVVPKLKEAIADLELGWIVDEDYVEFLSACPLIDEVISFPRKRWRKCWSLGEIGRWGRALRNRGYDTVLDLQGLARSGLMTWASGAERRIGLASAREGAGWAYTERVSDSQKHAGDRYRAACDYLAEGRLPAGHYQLPLPKTGLAGLPGSYFVIHPYSLWATKLWPWTNYQAVVNRLPEVCFVVVGTGDLFPLRGKNVVDLRNRTSIAELLKILGRARGVISTDSGPAHLTAAYGVPIMTLFGATDPERTGPIGSNSTIFTSDVPCRPCLNRQCESRHKMRCLREIPSQRVVDWVATFAQR